MILANQLLNEHLDNIGIRLRPVKPFTPNDFPAVQLYENIIKDAPIEHGFAFDSSGMPSTYLQGESTQVALKPWDIDVYNMSKRDDTSFWQDFHAPVSFVTHNHPSSANPNSISSKVYKSSPLSKEDLMYAANYEIPVRAVNNDGKVYEYIPGYSTPETIDKIVEDIPGILRVPKVLENVIQSRQHYNIFDDVVPKDINNLPKYNIYQNSLDKLPIPEMVSDSFNIRRKPRVSQLINEHLEEMPNPKKRMASFVQQPNGSYQSYIDGKPYKVLTKDEALTAVDKLKTDDNWEMNWKYHIPERF